MKDYRLTVTVRNNRILKAIEDAGGQPGGNWCAANGLSYSAVNNLITLKAGPLLKGGDLCPTALRLCEVLRKTPHELWSDSQLYPLETSAAEFELDAAEIAALHARRA